MFEIIIKLKNDWIDLSGVPDLELFEALKIWSNGSSEVVKIKGLSFKTREIVEIVISR